jgi:hypothetical protein
MYKKITHTIVEHHYDHPMALEMLANTHVVDNSKIKSTLSVMPADQFAQNIFDLFNSYMTHMRNYLISTLNSAPDQAYTAELVNSDIINISDVANSYFDKNSTQVLGGLFGSSVQNLHNVATALRAGQDISKFQSDYASMVSLFSQKLHTLDPTYWPASTIEQIFTDLNASWLTQMQARLKQDWTADSSALTVANSLVLNGYVTNGQTGLSPGLAEIFANGIIKQFPANFT